MGFAVPAAVVIVLTVSVYAGNALVATGFETTERVHLAEEDAIERMRERYETVLAITAVDAKDAKEGKANARVTIHVLNDGPHVLRPHRVSVIIDGVLRDADIKSLEVAGAPYESDVWGPGDTLIITVKPVPADPARIMVVSGNGASAIWRAPEV